MQRTIGISVYRKRKRLSYKNSVRNSSELYVEAVLWPGIEKTMKYTTNRKGEVK